MARRTGIAQLPLHGGRAPRWLFERMTALAPAVVEALVLDTGPDEVLRRLSDPYWFQAFGCALGFDWHSSGVTTVVCGALKAGLDGRETDTGIWVAGGKGRASRRTPRELAEHADRLGLDGDRLVHTSRLTAKVDSAAVQDGFQIYHHTFFHTRTGGWAVVQQGMRDGDAAARRYHWLGERARDLVEEPHAGIASDRAAATVLNLVARESAPTRSAAVEIAREDPLRIVREAERIVAASPPRPDPHGQLNLFDETGARADAPGAGAAAPGAAADVPTPHAAADVPASVLLMPARHAVDVGRDLDPRHLRKVLLSTYERAPEDFEALLAVRGVGPKAVRALALIAELVYGAPASVRDPARFSFAHGGKDGHPYPVDRETYDRSVEWLRDAVRRARMGRSDRTRALRRLARWEAARTRSAP